jgi:hypothetical protein
VTDSQVVEHVLMNYAEAEPTDEDAWHFTDGEVRSMLAHAIEATKEFQIHKQVEDAHVCVSQLGVSLANEHHQWTNEQRRNWEHAERILRQMLGR